MLFRFVSSLKYVNLHLDHRSGRHGVGEGQLSKQSCNIQIIRCVFQHDEMTDTIVADEKDNMHHHGQVQSIVSYFTCLMCISCFIDTKTALMHRSHQTVHMEAFYLYFQIKFNNSLHQFIKNTLLENRCIYFIYFQLY